MAEVIPFLLKRTADRTEAGGAEWNLLADATLGEIAGLLHAMLGDRADRHTLAQLSANLLALLPLVQHKPGGTRALDELYEAARLLSAQATNPQLVSTRQQDLYSAYAAFRTQVAATMTSPAA